jgi:hypothetical protein
VFRRPVELVYMDPFCFSYVIFLLYIPISY